MSVSKTIQRLIIVVGFLGISSIVLERKFMFLEFDLAPQLGVLNPNINLFYDIMYVGLIYWLLTAWEGTGKSE